MFAKSAWKNPLSKNQREGRNPVSKVLPIDLDDLLNHIIVESSRMECKRSWDESNTGYQAIRTVDCSFSMSK